MNTRLACYPLGLSWFQSHKERVVFRTLARGLSVMALISALTVVAAGIGYTGGRPGRESISTSQVRASADRELAAVARKIDRATVGETRVATFLAAEFGMTREAVLFEKSSLRTTWGNLTLAHTLAASDEMTAAQVLQLHDRGMGWGQIVAGLRLGLDDAIRAVNAESRVAMGRAKADHNVERIDADRF